MPLVVRPRFATAHAIEIRDADAVPVRGGVLLTTGGVAMPSLPLCPPERAALSATGATARMLQALAAQDLLPCAARASFEHGAWRVLSIEPSADRMR